MHHFKIWAPNVSRLRIAVDEKLHDMTLGDKHYWTAEIAEARHGSDYGFLVDDDHNPYPDPRSQQQPNGVHALSRVVDHAAFNWKTPASWSAVPLAEAVFYELHIGSFTPSGTCDGAIEKLAYLKDLGITHVELMPFASFEGRWGWGYDGVAIFAPQESYGGPDGLKRFVDACHGHGLAVTMDVVYNHFGPSGYYAGKFAPYLSDDGRHTEWGSVVNFHGEGSSEVRRFFIDNALMWMRDYRIDALRLDAIHALHDYSDPYFLTQLSAEVDALSQEMGRSLKLIAESSLNDAIIVTPRAEGGRGIDAQWSDDFHHSLHTVLTGEHRGYYHGYGSIALLAKSLHAIYVRPVEDSTDENHDPVHPVGHLTADHFLGYIQDHDQVGNRAFGERIHQLVGLAAARVAAALVFTGPSVPLIFQGEEFAASTPFLFFADHSDEELRRAVTVGRAKEFHGFGWGDDTPDPEDPNTFERSRIVWEDIADDQSEHCKMLRWHRHLMQLRREEPALTCGDLFRTKVTFDEHKRWLTMKRDDIFVVCNFSTSENEIALEAGLKMLLASEPNIQFSHATVKMPPLSVVILKQERS
jgi:maltooligosyltrehalose trehalohydrolase